MFITPLQRYKLKVNEAEVLTKVKSFEDVTMGHLMMTEAVLEQIGLDPLMVIKAVNKKRKKLDV